MLIQDLSKKLGTQAMTAVRGGDNGNSATNTIGQLQNLCVPVAVGAAGPANTSVHVSGSQYGSIWNYQAGGDHYSLMPYYGFSPSVTPV